MKVRVKMPPRYAEHIPPVVLEPGVEVEDGSIYLGCFDDKDWFVAAQDAKNEHGDRLKLSFYQAAQYARDLQAHGHDDWRLPPGLKDDKDREHDVQQEMYKSRHTGAFNGTYDETGANFSGWYWSSTAEGDKPFAWERRFSNGDVAGYRVKHYTISVRCVRAVPRKPPGMSS